MVATDKRSYYQDPRVVAGYESWRFGSRGGRHVEERERAVVLRFLSQASRAARILDMPVGTGRVARMLLAAGFSSVEGADLSDEMLRAARSNCGEGLMLSRQDAAHTGFADASFDAVVSMRFLFHYADAATLLREIGRIVRPGGLVVFDTLTWSPRAVLPRVQNRLGGLVYPMAPAQVREQSARAGLDIEEVEEVFLLPSLAYRFLPGALLRPVASLERVLPSRWRTKCIWKARKR
jgi:ubiquinone/menaquinone biosynthesis C-methylase UbiE